MTLDLNRERKIKQLLSIATDCKYNLYTRENITIDVCEIVHTSFLKCSDDSPSPSVASTSVDSLRARGELCNYRRNGEFRP